ncbi:hypothetical protein FQN49_004030 [Arthroderma sp. PD_2]|nr:hypothetical protein FQN49_004030 [Arthroderma sp. PD_2]
MPPARREIVPIESPEHSLLTLTQPTEDLSERILIYKSKMIPRAVLPARSLDVGLSFSVLPTELLFLILSYLDIRSLELLRQLNFGIMNLVDSFRPYWFLIQHVPAALQALAATRVLSKFTATDLFQALKSRYCFSCGGAGEFLFIPLAKRCCRLCLQAAEPLKLISLSDAKECFGLPGQVARHLPIVLMTRGRYGFPLREYTSRRWIVSLSEAKEAGIKLHGSEAEMERFVAPTFMRRNVKYLLKSWTWVTLAAVGENIGRPPYRPRSRSEKLETSYVRSNYRVCTPFPSINFDMGIAVYPRACKGCAEEKAHFLQTYPQNADDYLEQELVHIKRTQTAWWVENFHHHLPACRGIKKLLSK